MMAHFWCIVVVVAAVSPGAAQSLAPASAIPNPKGEVTKATELAKRITDHEEDIRVWLADVKAVTKVRDIERAEYERLPQPVSSEDTKKETESFQHWWKLRQSLMDNLGKSIGERLSLVAQADATKIANSLFAMRISKQEEDIRVWHADLKAVTKVREIERAEYEHLPQPVSIELRQKEMEAEGKHATLVEHLWQSIAQANREREEMLADTEEVKETETEFLMESLEDGEVLECQRNTGCFSLQLEGAGRFAAADLPEINWGVSWKLSESHRTLFANLLDSNGDLAINVTSGIPDHFCVLALGGDPGSQAPEYLRVLEQRGLHCEFVTMQGPQGVHAYKLRTYVTSGYDDCGLMIDSETLNDCPNKMLLPVLKKAAHVVAKDANEVQAFTLMV